MDPLLDLMTGYEMLWFFGRIRGMDPILLEQRVQSLIDQVGLRPFANKICGRYSGGNKRKLSLAVALIGDPSVLLLDEPSTGMDPEARRKCSPSGFIVSFLFSFDLCSSGHMWDVIAQVSASRSVVLTTHSMEECEALCTRVGIMVSGRLQCLGSSQHLKSRFGAGYQIEIRCEEGHAADVLAFFLNGGIIPNLEVEEQHGSFVRLGGPKDLDLELVFRTLDEKKVELGIVDYSVSQATLEQVSEKY